MKQLNIILILLLLVSCTDRTKFSDVGKATLKAIIKNDTIKLKELFVHNMDSLYGNQKDYILRDILKYKDKNYSFIKSDTSIFKFRTLDEQWTYINTYFKLDTSYYKLSTKYSKDDKGKISIETIFISDLTEGCKNWTNKPYCPSNDIKFKRISWTTDYWNKSFKSGKVELENQTENDIEYVKFKVILKNNYQIFFNQTVIYKEKIFAGDITTIEIPGMVDLFTGFTIDRDNLQFDSDLIEVLPKPESSDCIKILELKAFK
jgi:hypothetical protein